jgi:hypothetical protein
MATRKRRLKSIGSELVSKSREAAITAIKIFNDPLIRFKSESYIVLMMIAWTYLLHAYYRKKKIDYRYYEQNRKRKKYHRTKRGTYKYWELERCLNEGVCPIDKDTGNNLRFLIGLRHEIEHQMTLALDAYLSGRYQACVINYNDYLVKLFGKKHSLDQNLSFTLQFVELSEEQLSGPKPEIEIPARLRAYIVEFDDMLSHEEYNNQRYSYRMVFKRKLVNRPGQADRVVEFIDPNSELAKTIDKEYWVKKEVERKKLRPKEIVDAVQRAGFPRFRMHEHTSFWQAEDAKNPGKGFGVVVSGQWFWYESWLEHVLKHVKASGNQYK